MNTSTNNQISELLRDSDFEELKAKTFSRFNIFDAIGMSSQEIRHSHFLAFLFDPSANHGLGDLFLKYFLLKVNGIPTDSFDLRRAKVETEHSTREGHRIDILIRDEDNDNPLIPLIVIENKINAGESEGQLTRYYEYIRDEKKFANYLKRLFFFLSPSELIPQNAEDSENYISVKYEKIIAALGDILINHLPDISSEVVLLIQHYIRMMERYIGRNDFTELYQSLWSKYRTVLEDLKKEKENEKIFYEGQELFLDTRIHDTLAVLLENKPDIVVELLAYLAELVNKADMLVIREARTNLNFRPKSWNSRRLASEHKWNPEQQVDFRFWFDFDRIKFTFRIGLTLGEGPQEIRSKMFNELLQRNTGIFKPASKKLQSKYNMLFTHFILEEADVKAKIFLDEAIKGKIDKFWQEFNDNTIREMTQIVRQMTWLEFENEWA